MIKAVIFDMDGVILDTEKLYCRFWMEAAREAGYDWQFEHSLMIRSLAGEFSGPLMKGIFGDDFDIEEIRRRRTVRMNAYLEDHPLEKKPGIDALLDYLRSHGYKTAIATASNRTRAMGYLGQVGLQDRFDQFVCTAMVAHGKPMPDVYLYACQQIGEKPEDCMAVEDSPNGILAASRAGCKAVMVPDLSQPDAELEKLLFAKADGLMDIIHFLS